MTCVDPNKGRARALPSLALAPEQDFIEVAASEPDVSYDVEMVYENEASVG